MTFDDLTLGFVGCGQGDGPAAVADTPVRRTRATGNSLNGLLRTIEGDIVPRLMLTRCTELPLALAVERPPTEAEVAELVRLLLAHDSGVAIAFALALHREGIALETLCLDLLAPAARRIGYLWEQDRADIMQVSLALARLHTVLREVSLRDAPPGEALPVGERVLLVPAPGEQHTFGLLMVAEFFRRSGWDVCSEFPNSTSDLLELVASERFAVVGLSCACDVRLDGLTSRIQSVRRASRNRTVGVMVGGRSFVERPELVGLVGADATAADGRQAAQRAKRLRGLLAAAH